MRSKILLFTLLFTGSLLACNDHLFRIGLNQRSFYNPAALCPYCDGSWFVSSGLNFGPGAGTRGMYFAFGNDAMNFAHGPWDVTYAQQRTSEYAADQYSFRYAWAQPLGNKSWKLAGGIRGSFYSVKERGYETNSPVMPIVANDYHANLPDFDAGAMIANKEYGFYFGFSVQHLTAPEKNVPGENGVTHVISLTRDYTVMTGYVQRLWNRWDLLPDAAYNQSKDGFISQASLSVRYLHHFGLGAGVTLVQNEDPQFDIRGGYTSSKFKWLVSAAPCPTGWSVETGLVARFGFEDKNGPPCTGGECRPPKPPKEKKRKKKDEFAPHR